MVPDVLRVWTRSNINTPTREEGKYQKFCVVKRRSPLKQPEAVLAWGEHPAAPHTDRHQPRMAEVSLFRQEVEHVFSIPSRKCWTVSSVSSPHKNCKQRTSVATRWHQMTCSVQCSAVEPTGQRVHTMLISDANQKNSEGSSEEVT